STGRPGELGYLRDVPPGQGYDAGLPGSYVGQFVVRPQAITRAPVDAKYHCGNTQSGCGARVDVIDNLDQLYNQAVPTMPAGYKTFPNGGQSCSNPPANLNGANWLVNCPSFDVKNGPVAFDGGGVIVFTGALNIDSNGSLLVNAKTQGGAPVLDPTGLPVAK